MQAQPPPPPRVVTIELTDDPRRWQALGFRVCDAAPGGSGDAGRSSSNPAVFLSDGTAIVFVRPAGSDGNPVLRIDNGGVPVVVPAQSGSSPIPPPTPSLPPTLLAQHPNGCVGVDHVVVAAVGDVDAAAAALARALGGPPLPRRFSRGQMRFVYFRLAGGILLELIGTENKPPAAQSSSVGGADISISHKPSSAAAAADDDARLRVWGVTFAAPSLEAVAAAAGAEEGATRRIRPAVQRGRFIMPVDRVRADVGLEVAFITPRGPAVPATAAAEKQDTGAGDLSVTPHRSRRMATNDDELLSYVRSILADELALSDDSYAEYVAQLAADDSMAADEKLLIICEFLDEATERKTESLVTAILEKAESLLSAKRQAAETEQQKKVEAIEHCMAALAAQSLHDDQPEVPKRSGQPQLSKEERRRREMLLRTYGYEADEVVENEDGEAEILYSGATGNSATATKAEASLFKNDNSDRVREAQHQRKAKMQSDHAAKVQRDKDALQKQLLEKEKEKRRTQKKEKRRM
ncbi:hypothetical protein HK405_010881 [Cladochytrium tenue]|nr:hypothetical protein HK405_010881 [Cladochytrium tenue]